MADSWPRWPDEDVERAFRELESEVRIRECPHEEQLPVTVASMSGTYGLICAQCGALARSTGNMTVKQP